jgi:hypothetical protein
MRYGSPCFVAAEFSWHHGLYIGYAIVLGVGFFIAVFIKGERPRRHWGKH